MEILTAAERLAALGHDARLTIFRLLVQAGSAGLSAGAIGEAVGMAPNALSFHLSHLSRVGLIEGRRESRFIHYTARFGAMNELIGFLTENCCQGEPCLPAPLDCIPAREGVRAPVARAQAAGSANAADSTNVLLAPCAVGNSDATGCACAPVALPRISSRKKSRP